MHELPPEIRQITATLPHFNECVPMLYKRNGMPYVPLVVLCRLLGVRMKVYLPSWRKMPFWHCACKLPLQTPTRGKQLVWCLPFGALPLWYSTLNCRNIVPDRREQLQHAKSELASLPEIIYRENCRYYQHLQGLLQHFLTVYTDTTLFFEQLVRQIAPFLTEEDQVWLKELIVQGQEMIAAGLTIAQKIRHEQEALPLIEAFHLDHYGIVIETDQLPLLPAVSTEDQESFFECLALLGEWHQDLVDFLKEQKQR